MSAHWKRDTYPGWPEALRREVDFEIQAAIEIEREACARLVWDFRRSVSLNNSDRVIEANDEWNRGLQKVCLAIRSRGLKP